METVARIFESCREDRLPASRAGRVAVAQEAGAACAEVPESRARRIPFSVEMFPPKGQLTLDAARKVVEGLRAAGVETVLALRGDLAPGQEPADFRYAYELIPRLKAAGLCVGAAAYPEGHIDCLDPRENIRHLRAKQDAGADFFITQLFFNNDDFYRFREAAESAGVAAPISCGIMPFLGKSQIQRMVFLCGSSLPAPIIKLLAKYENDPVALRQAGIEYACNQLVDLGRHGVNGLHVYAMNQPDIACAAAEAVAAAGLR